MAHKEKYSIAAAGHMLAHYDRSKEVPDLLAPDQTALNYNLAQSDQPLKQLDFLHQRLGEVRVHNRKDVNVMVDWVITLPQSIPQGSEDMTRFFGAVYDFLKDRYGKENTISAYVHMDETTPHMHFAFVPVVRDVKRGGFKLCAKEAVTREDLRTFHGDLGKYMENIFGRDVGIENGATKEGNQSIADLKRGTAQKALAKYEQKLQASKDTLRDIQNKDEWISSLSPKKLFAGLLSGETLKDIHRLKKMAKDGLRAASRLITLENEVSKLKKENKKLNRAVIPLKEQFRKYDEEKRLKEIEAAFLTLPKEVQERARQDSRQQVKRLQQRKRLKEEER